MIMDRALGFGANSDAIRSSGSAVPALAPNEQEVAEEEIGDADVLLGRGKSYTKHPGIVRFQGELQSHFCPRNLTSRYRHNPKAIINQNIDRYFAVSTHQEKKDITDEIVKEIQSTGRFLRYEPERKKWIRINHETARTKVAQAIQYRQRRRAKGYDISSIEGLVGGEAVASSETRKRRGSFADSGRQPSGLPSELHNGLLGGSQGLLGPRGDELLSSNLQNRWAPLSRSDPCMGMANLATQQVPRTGRLSYEQSLDLALSQLQRRQQDHQQDRFLSNRRQEPMGLLPYSDQQVTNQQQEPDDTRSATAIGDCLEPIRFEALQQAPVAAATSLPSAAFASSPADTAWQVQLLQAIQQQQQQQHNAQQSQAAAFTRQHQASNSMMCPNDPISIHHPSFATESSIGRIAPINHPAAASLRQQQPEPESQAHASSFLDPLPFEIGTVAPVPEESKSIDWANKTNEGNQDDSVDQDRKPSPGGYPL